MPGEPSLSDVDEALVMRLAALVGLELTAEQLPGVTATLRRTLMLAQAMDSVSLEPTQESGPIWRP
jgi:hypothetical protein